jgi:hypothetical protein
MQASLRLRRRWHTFLLKAVLNLSCELWGRTVVCRWQLCCTQSVDCTDSAWIHEWNCC